MADEITISIAGSRAPGKATVYGSIAELTGTIGSSREPIVFVTGYASQGDGGEGMFVWKENGSQADADGGCIVQGGGSIGTWVRAFSGPINVLWYGASRTRASSATSAIQAALDAAAGSAVPSSAVYIPQGQYSLQSALDWPLYSSGGTLRVAPSVTLYGDGGNDFNDSFGTWLYQDFNGGNLINFSGGDAGEKIFYDKIHSLSMFQSSSYATAGDMLSSSEGSTYLTLQDIVFGLQNPAASWLSLIDGPTGMLTIERTKGRMATGASVPMVDIAVEDAAPYANLFGINVNQNFWESNDTATAPIFRMDGHGISFATHIQNTIFEFPRGGAIEMRSVRHWTISDCVSDDLVVAPTQPLIWIRKALSGGSPLPPHSCVLSGNNFANGTDTYPDVEVESGPGNGPVTLIGGKYGFVRTGATSTAIGQVELGVASGSTTPYRLLTNGAVTGTKSISGTSTSANNLRGSVTISDTATSATVTFGTEESDDSYFVTATATAESGTPATGSARHKITSKADVGFDIEVETAPGAGNSVTFDWILVR